MKKMRYFKRTSSHSPIKIQATAKSQRPKSRIKSTRGKLRIFGITTERTEKGMIYPKNQLLRPCMRYPGFGYYFHHGIVCSRLAIFPTFSHAQLLFSAKIYITVLIYILNHFKAHSAVGIRCSSCSCSHFYGVFLMFLGIGVEGHNG